MKLYLGNSTKQRREFYYRVPGEAVTGPHHCLAIPPGRQDTIPGDHTRAVLDSIIEPYLKHGWKNVSELSRSHAFVGMCYSFDKPISENLLNYTIDANDGHLDDAAKDELVKFAMANSVLLENEDPNAPQIKQIDVCVDDIRDPRDMAHTPRADGVSITKARPDPVPRKRARA